MYERCPVCDLRYERDPGYFLGAMYVAFILAVGDLSVVIAALWVVTRWTVGTLLWVGGAIQVLLTPAVFRYSRVIWMHLDWALFPEPDL